MTVQILAHHFSLSENETSYVEEKLHPILTILGNIAKAEEMAIHIDIERQDTKAAHDQIEIRATFSLPGKHSLYADARGGTVMEVVDLVQPRIESQVRKLKTRLDEKPELGLSEIFTQMEEETEEF